MVVPLQCGPAMNLPLNQGAPRLWLTSAEIGSSTPPPHPRDPERAKAVEEEWLNGWIFVSIQDLDDSQVTFYDKALSKANIPNAYFCKLYSNCVF